MVVLGQVVPGVGVDAHLREVGGILERCEQRPGGLTGPELDISYDVVVKQLEEFWFELVRLPQSSRPRA